MHVMKSINMNDFLDDASVRSRARHYCFVRGLHIMAHVSGSGKEKEGHRKLIGSSI